MKRDEWTFQFQTDKLADAATAKVAFHTSRLEFWQGAKKEAMDKAKADGISISESPAGHTYTSASNRAGFGPVVSIDETMQLRISEAHSKCQQHADKVKEYEGWVQVFSANKGRSLDLTADDYLFFFGK